jgi:hypothetical protein
MPTKHALPAVPLPDTKRSRPKPKLTALDCADECDDASFADGRLRPSEEISGCLPPEHWNDVMAMVTELFEEGFCDDVHEIPLVAKTFVEGLKWVKSPDPDFKDCCLEHAGKARDMPAVRWKLVWCYIKHFAGLYGEDCVKGGLFVDKINVHRLEPPQEWTTERVLALFFFAIVGTHTGFLRDDLKFEFLELFLAELELVEADDQGDDDDVPCCLCGTRGYPEDFHNAAPVVKGRCCTRCNYSIVIPARVAQAVA